MVAQCCPARTGRHVSQGSGSTQRGLSGFTLSGMQLFLTFARLSPHVPPLACFLFAPCHQGSRYLGLPLLSTTAMGTQPPLSLGHIHVATSNGLSQTASPVTFVSRQERYLPETRSSICLQGNRHWPMRCRCFGRSAVPCGLPRSRVAQFATASSALSLLVASFMSPCRPAPLSV